MIRMLISNCYKLNVSSVGDVIIQSEVYSSYRSPLAVLRTYVRWDCLAVLVKIDIFNKRMSEMAIFD
jgi:hypothetical protein